MSIFATSAPAKPARTSDSLKIATLYAGILTVMALAQLFTFEDFIVYIQSLNLPVSETAVYSLVPVLIIAEIFAIPFLLRMRLSLAFRYFSMFLGWAAAILWVFISLWVLFGVHNATTIGFFGTVANIAPGWWVLFVSFALSILAAWSSWGLWPGKRSGK